MCNSITSYGRMSLLNSKYLKKEKLHSRFLSTAKKINIYGKLHKLQLISDLNRKNMIQEEERKHWI